MAFAFAAVLTREVVEIWFLVGQTPDWTRDLRREWLGFSFSPASPAPVLLGSLQPAFQNTIGLFHCAVTTFPLSVPAAVLFLANVGGVLGSLLSRLWQRDRFWALPVSAFLLLAALAALGKPFALSPWYPESGVSWIIGRELLLWLAFAFEYALGVFVQVAIAMRVLEWVRGMHFEESRFLPAVTRRFVIVWHWLWLVFVGSSLLFYLPPLLAVAGGAEPSTGRLVWQDLLFALLLLPFAPVQALLIFHNYRLGKAFAASASFMRRHLGALLWMLLLAVVHWYALEATIAWTVASLGELNIYAWLLRLLAAPLTGLMTGWLFATWICLFKQVESGHEEERRWLAH